MSTSNTCIMTVNGGSSSIKFALFEAKGDLRRILAGRIEGIDLPEGTFSVKATNTADDFSRQLALPDHTAAVNPLMDWIQARSDRNELTAVGHRVVHGGLNYLEPQRITPAMIETLRQPRYARVAGKGDVRSMSGGSGRTVLLSGEEVDLLLGRRTRRVGYSSLLRRHR